MIVNYDSLGRGRDTWLKKEVGDSGITPFAHISARSWLVSLWLFVMLMAMSMNGQTTLISPTGDGGFENGSTLLLMVGRWRIMLPLPINLLWVTPSQVGQLPAILRISLMVHRRPMISQ